ncbi:hypothetical protein BGZ89_000637, partial [Linnemannia elongata]
MLYQLRHCGLLQDVKLMFDELDTSWTRRDSRVCQSSAGYLSVRRVVPGSRSRKRMQGYWNED